METISVFEIFKIGIGPSSSHTMGPWKACKDFVERYESEGGALEDAREIGIVFFGSLAKTGKGHGSDLAALMGWSGAEMETFDADALPATVEAMRSSGHVSLLGKVSVPFAITFSTAESRHEHPNAMEMALKLKDGAQCKQTYYSIGGGFIRRKGGEALSAKETNIPFPIQTAEDMLTWTESEGKSIAEISMANELRWRAEDEIHARLSRIWEVMRESIFIGCHAEGELPGGLHVQRRAPKISGDLLEGKACGTLEEWARLLKSGPRDMPTVTSWVSCFALAVNEVNASYGRIVTSPTNGAAGVIPAVLMHYDCFSDGVTPRDIREFLLVAGEIACLFKKGATISAAVGGCQAEIGVSSAMAAGALTHALGGTAGQVLMAAEIAMEHHLGLTCDPVGGLVQIPCIERNAMGAMKAITAAHVALHGDPGAAKVSLDDVIQTMWATAQDMKTKYKETSEGGLALRISIDHPEC